MSRNFCTSSSDLAALRQLRFAGFVALALVSVCLAVTLTMDPYGIFNLVEIKGLNQYRVAASNAERQYQFLRLAVARPEIAIMGSSRAALGLDPRNPVLAEGGLAANIAISGPNIHEVRVMLDHANAVAPLRRVVLALDFLMFNAWRPDRPELARLEQRSGVFPAYLLPEFFLSIDALTESWKTMEAGKAAILLPRRPDGMMEAVRFPPVTWTSWLDGIGSYVEHSWTEGPDRCFGFVAGDRDALAELAHIIAMARKNNIDLRIILSPVHVTLLEGLQDAGLGLAYDEWVRQVVGLAGTDVPVWSFDMPSAITSEAIPRGDGSAKPMAGYMDHTHYVPWVGTKALDKVFGGPTASDDFGEKLTADSVEGHLSRLRAALAAYAAANGAEAEQIAAAVRSALGGVTVAHVTTAASGPLLKCRRSAPLSRG